ncbi:uncharacterized protein zgc:152816 [Engraulis encrasicolus]|uniref:uncharacterized protein zgc:152816 n=1 Tax=Engraulis encrasicolus TaxID=184585 RepID=UPI002FD5DCC4
MASGTSPPGTPSYAYSPTGTRSSKDSPLLSIRVTATVVPPHPDIDRRPPHPDNDRRQPHPDIVRRPTHPVKRPAPRPVPPLDPMLPIKRVYQNGPPKLKTHSTHPIQRAAFRTRVVVTKFPLGSVTVKDLLELAEPFGTVLKHLVFPAKGFLEFSSYHEAQAMVSHFYDKLDFTNKHKIYIYLSPNVQCIQIPEDRDAKYTTVVFTNLPDDSKATMDKVLEIVEMFGAVRHSSINGTEAHVKMIERKDARIMVKYYGNRPLKQLGKNTHVNLLAEHRDNRHQSEDSKTATTSSSSSAAAAAAKDKGDGVEKTGEDVRLEEKKVRAGPRGEASQPDAAWAELREEDLDPEEEEEVELGEEEEGEGGMMVEDEEEEDDGIPVEDEQGLLEDADHDLDNSTEVTEEAHEEGAEPSERANPEQASGEEDNQEEMCEFPENLDDFVTLDELDSGTDMTVTNDFGGGKVVLIRPIKGYPPKNALMKLADPFGKVVHHLISRYRQEALLQLETEEQVREMVAFYRESKEAAVINGRPVTICICRTLKEIEVPSGRSVYISNLPMGKFSDVDLLTLARPYGPITAYRINRGPRACYIQFESEECASNMLKKNSRPPFRGSILTIFPCRKPDSTIPWIKVVVPLGREDRKEEENGGEEEKERRAAKRRREEGDEQGVCGDLEAEEQKTDDTEETQPDTPAGLHYIVAGFYCKLCNVFYDDETKAKTEHASSAEHHKNLRQKRKKPNA